MSTEKKRGNLVRDFVPPVLTRKVEVLETLRDARQMIADVDVRLDEMLRFIQGQVSLGVNFVEIGFAIDAFTQDLARMASALDLKETKLAVFGRTIPEDLEAIAEMKELGVNTAVIVCKSRLMDVANDLKISPEENLELVRKSVRYLKDGGFFVILDLEFAMDAVYGRKEYGEPMNNKDREISQDYFFQVVDAGIAGGADRLVICDTTGGSLPQEVAGLFDVLVSEYPQTSFGIHCHDDFGLAVANTVEAINHGAIQAQVVLNGYGERAGNTNAAPLYAVFQERMKQPILEPAKIKKLTEVAENLSVAFGFGRDTGSPVTGRFICSTSAGMHQAGNNKAPGTYLAFNPLNYGNHAREVVNRQSGIHSIMAKASQMSVPLTREQAEELRNKYQEMIRCSAFEMSDDAFQMACWIVRGEFQPFFQIREFEVRSMSDGNGGKKLARGNVKLSIGNRLKFEIKDGNGPYDALSPALRKALKYGYPSVRNVILRSYQLKALEVTEGGSGSLVRVITEFTDNNGNIWNSVGISTDSNEAGFKALIAGLEYYLFYTGAENKHSAIVA